MLYCSGSMCVGVTVVRLGWCGILMQAEALLKMDVLTFETC